MKTGLRFGFVLSIFVGSLMLQQPFGQKVDAAAGLEGTIWVDAGCANPEECSYYNFDTASHYWLKDGSDLAESGTYRETGNVVRMTESHPYPAGSYTEGTISGKEMKVRDYQSEGKLLNDRVDAFRRIK